MGTKVSLILILDFMYSRPETRGLRECRMNKRKVEGGRRDDKAANMNARRAESSILFAHNFRTAFPLINISNFPDSNPAIEKCEKLKEKKFAKRNYNP